MTEEALLWRHPASVKPPQHDARQARDPEFIRTLGQDLKARGMRQPICCRVVGNELEVVAGETRRQAALLVGLASIPIRIIREELPPGALLLEQLLENDLRREFSYLERASLYVSLLQANDWTQAQLAEATGKSPAEIAKVLAIKGRLPEDLIGKVQDGQLPISVAYALSKLREPTAMRELAERYMTGVLCRDGVVAEATRRLKGQPSRAKPIRFRDGNVAIQVPGEWTWDQLSALTQKLVEAAKRGGKLDLPFASLPDLYRKL